MEIGKTLARNSVTEFQNWKISSRLIIPSANTGFTRRRRHHGIFLVRSSAQRLVTIARLRFQWPVVVGVQVRRLRNRTGPENLLPECRSLRGRLRSLSRLRFRCLGLVAPISHRRFLAPWLRFRRRTPAIPDSPCSDLRLESIRIRRKQARRVWNPSTHEVARLHRRNRTTVRTDVPASQSLVPSRPRCVFGVPRRFVSPMRPRWVRLEPVKALKLLSLKLLRWPRLHQAKWTAQTVLVRRIRPLLLPRHLPLELRRRRVRRCSHLRMQRLRVRRRLRLPLARRSRARFRRRFRLRRRLRRSPGLRARALRIP